MVFGSNNGVKAEPDMPTFSEVRNPNPSLFSMEHKAELEHGVSIEDRIGRLPDAMLCDILSFLETKYAVRTSILSKRWRYVWTSVPCIDIQYHSYAYSIDFIDFIDKLLRINTVSCLRKFCLVLRRYEYKQLSEWINIVLNRDIEEIVLHISSFRSQQCVKLPPSIFTCKKLVILRLSEKIILDIPSSVVYLPSLKILNFYLGQSFDEDVDSMTHILDGCPVLEELSIRGVEKDYFVNTLLVRSSSLKSLSIYGCRSNLRIVLDVPNVERLDLIGTGNGQYDIKNLSSLVKLNTNIMQDSGLVEVLGKFTNTEYMVISYDTIRSLECQPLDNFPIFPNLAHLVVDNSGYRRTFLSALLECSPNLVTLVSYSRCMGQSRAEQLHHFKEPKCMMLYLEEIEIKGFKGFMHEIEMIGYFLKNSMVLKKLSIQSIYSRSQKHSEIFKSLHTFPRSSPKCQIIF